MRDLRGETALVVKDLTVAAGDSFEGRPNSFIIRVASTGARSFTSVLSKKRKMSRPDLGGGEGGLMRFSVLGSWPACQSSTLLAQVLISLGV